MSILSRLFGRKQASPVVSPVLRSADRSDVHRGFDVDANRDIVTGYKFCATIQMRTPLRVLLRHGEVHREIGSEPPTIAKEMSEGIWIPIARTFREMGLDVEEPAFTMASDIGPIPQDGGDYLKFLLVLREAAERSAGIEERREAVTAIVHDSCWAHPVEILGGPLAIIDRLFPRFVTTVPRMPEKVAEALILAGYGSPKAIQTASDAQLLAFNGIGPAMLLAIRAHAKVAPEPESQFTDKVVR